MELKHTLTEIVKNPAVFDYYRDGNLIYHIFIIEGEQELVKHTYQFPIDTTNTEDIGNAKFEASYSKALPLMRYIRKSIADKTVIYSSEILH